MIQWLKGIARNVAIFVLMITLGASLFWMLACVMTFFSASKYLTLGHFILAGFIASFSGGCLTSLVDKREP